MHFTHIQAHGLTFEADPTGTHTFYGEGEFRGCGCGGCRNYTLAWKYLSPEVQSFLVQLGLKPHDPLDVVAVYAPDAGTICYNIYFSVCGRVLDGLMAPDALAPREIHPHPFRHILLPGDCDALVCEPGYGHPQEFPHPRFKVELLVDLPWLLEEENPY